MSTVDTIVISDKVGVVMGGITDEMDPVNVAEVEIIIDIVSVVDGDISMTDDAVLIVSTVDTIVISDEVGVVMGGVTDETDSTNVAEVNTDGTISIDDAIVIVVVSIVAVSIVVLMVSTVEGTIVVMMSMVVEDAGSIVFSVVSEKENSTESISSPDPNPLAVSVGLGVGRNEGEREDNTVVDWTTDETLVVKTEVEVGDCTNEDIVNVGVAALLVVMETGVLSDDIVKITLVGMGLDEGIVDKVVDIIVVD